MGSEKVVPSAHRSKSSVRCSHVNGARARSTTAVQNGARSAAGANGTAAAKVAVGGDTGTLGLIEAMDLNCESVRRGQRSYNDGLCHVYSDLQLYPGIGLVVSVAELTS